MSFVSNRLSPIIFTKLSYSFSLSYQNCQNQFKVLISLDKILMLLFESYVSSNMWVPLFLRSYRPGVMYIHIYSDPALMFFCCEPVCVQMLTLCCVVHHLLFCVRWRQRRGWRYSGRSAQDRVWQCFKEGQYHNSKLFLERWAATPPHLNENLRPCVGVHLSSNINNTIKINLAASLPLVN